jgi:hypothetical protein
VFGDGEVKIKLVDLSIIWGVEMKKSDIRKAMRIVKTHQDYMLDQWRLQHG